MQVDSESPNASHPEGGIDDERVSIDPPRVRRKSRQHGLLDVVAVERPLGKGLDTAVDANRRGGARDEQQIAPAPRGKKPQPGLDTRQVAGAARGGISGVQFENEPIDIVVGCHGILTGSSAFQPIFYSLCVCYRRILIESCGA
jgi:hypothetical protein